MDAGLAAPWTQLAWTPNRPYGKPLPDNGASETAYNEGDANLNGIAVLLHLDEATGADSYTNAANSVAAPGPPYSKMRPLPPRTE